MKNAKKITMILIAATMTMGLFVGCSSKASDTSATTNQQVAASGTNRKFDPAAMKKNYEDALKALVTAGTITQDQSDKVLAEVTKNVPKAGSQDKTQSSQQSGKEKNNGAGNGQNKPRNNQLTSLVNSGVITQAQADSINQKIRENMKNTQSN